VGNVEDVGSLADPALVVKYAYKINENLLSYMEAPIDKSDINFKLLSQGKAAVGHGCLLICGIYTIL